VADQSVSECGLVLTGPEVGGYLEISFTPLPEGPDAPDADWSDPRWNDPSRWTTEPPLDPSDYDASFDEWLEHFDADYPPADQVQDDHKRLGLVFCEFAERLAYGHFG
jgi:hypothetical protein